MVGVGDRVSRSDARRRHDGRHKGFALVTVIWGLGLIALLVVSHMTDARLRLQTAFNLASATKADLLAQAAINNAIFLLMTEQSNALPPAQEAQGLSAAARAGGTPPGQQIVHNGEPRLCSIDDGAVVVAIEDEGGKIDLNGAPKRLLAALLGGFGLGQSDADAAASAIIAFRSFANNAEETNQAGAAGAPNLKHAPFQTIFELEQVSVSQTSFLRNLLPFVTVHSRHPGIDPQAAPPALFAALAGFSTDEVDALRRTPFPNSLDRADPRFPSTFKHGGGTGVFLIHAEARLPSGQISVQEAVVDLHSNTGSSAEKTHFAIRELRKGVSQYAEVLRAAMTSLGAPGC